MDFQKTTFPVLATATSGDSVQTSNYLAGAGDNSSLIQDALDETSAKGGGVVFVKNGLYGMTKPIIMPANVTIQGEKNTKQSGVGNKGGVMFRVDEAVTTTNPIQAIFISKGQDYVNQGQDLLIDAGRFQNVTIDGNGGRALSCIDILNSDSLKFEDCTIRGALTGIKGRYNGIGSDGLELASGDKLPGGIRASDSIISSILGGTDIDLEYFTQCWFHNIWSESAGKASRHMRLK
jgi:hypothetical protein